nr:curlin [Shewanella sp.]
DLNVIDLIIEGDENTAQITQSGNGNWVGGDNDTSFASNSFGVSGDNNSLSITQTGNDNLVLGSQAGTNNSINVNQSGNMNVATVVQY